VAHIWFILPSPYYPVDRLNLGPACRALPSAVPKRFVGVLQAQARHRYAEDRTGLSALVMSLCRRGAGVGSRESREGCSVKWWAGGGGSSGSCGGGQLIASILHRKGRCLVACMTV
jgi:uncharacterized membrane protein YgcG